MTHCSSALKFNAPATTNLSSLFEALYIYSAHLQTHFTLNKRHFQYHCLGFHGEHCQENSDTQTHFPYKPHQSGNINIINWFVFLGLSCEHASWSTARLTQGGVWRIQSDWQMPHPWKLYHVRLTNWLTASPVYIIIIIIIIIISSSISIIGARGGVVVKALRYNPAGRGFDSRWCQWNFSVT
jgi:hypothetical protein